MTSYELPMQRSALPETAAIVPNFVHFGSAFLLYNVLIYSYLEVNVPLWGYLGYTADFSWGRYVIAAISLLFVRSITPRRIDSFSGFVLASFSALTMTAMAVMYAARGYDFAYFAAVIIFYTLIWIISRRIRFKVRPTKGSIRLVLGLSMSMISLTVAWIAAKGGLGRLNFDFSLIYQMRDDASSAYFQFPFNYFNSWASKIFAPVVLAIGLIYRRWWIVAFAAIAEIIYFGAYAQKLPLAMIAFALFAMWAVPRQIKTSWLDILLAVAVGGSTYLYFYNENAQIVAIFVNRVFIGPANNNILYYEFFLSNPHTFFSNSFLRGMIEYPLPMHIFDLISIERIGDTSINPNTGALGTGYMHMGFFGLVFYALVVGIIMSAVESLAKSHPAWVPVAVAGPPTLIMLTSADVSVALITNGLFLAMLLIFLWPSAKHDRF